MFSLLDAGVQNPVTLVCAGAGWGKTMLVSTWARTRTAPVAWLSLDKHDNDPQRFWGYVLAALDAAGIVPPNHALAELRSVPTDERERGRLLSSGFGQLSNKTVLVLDDFHEIDDPRVLQEMNDLLRRPPTPLRLVLISRQLPALAVQRLRAEGQVAEIRADDLMFTDEEAAALAHGHGLELAAAEVGQLLERTEGWAAGLQLGAGFLADGNGGRSIADLAGDIRSIDDYLTNEVLANWPANERRFLLQTSICERLCAGLANAITARHDGQRTLEQLEHSNDFVVRLGAKPLWFRYHHLMRDALRHRLSLEDPAAVAELHRRAARWYAANNSVLEALDHSLAAQDWPYVGQLVATQGAPLILSPQQDAFLKILQRVPPDQSSSTPELIFCSVVLLFQAGNYEAIPARIARAREMLGQRGDTATRRPTELMLLTPEMLAERAVGNMRAVIAVSTQLLDLLAADASADGLVATQQRAVALNHRGLALLWTGRPEAAARDLRAAASAARTADLELTEMNATGHLALLQIFCGSADEAAQLATGVRTLAERRGWRYSLQTVAAHFAQALVELERHDLDAAQEALRQGTHAHHGNPEAAQRLVALGIEARLAVTRREPTRARLFLDEARRERSPRLHAPTLDRWMSLIEAEVDLASGGSEQPHRADITLAPDATLDFAHRVARARFAFAAHDLRRAEELLRYSPTTLTQTVATVEAGVLGAIVADARGHAMQAVDQLRDTVALAAREGIRRPFFTMADSRLDAIMQRLRLLGGETPFLDQIISEVRAGTGVSADMAIAQGLSEREIEVLRYLPTMLSAAEIAGLLGVSVNTVKAHLRAIYRKLGAARRSEAVAIARQRGIL
ncbi:LuxR C-terminal-related transcriptional regulator [Cryptosporangium minutisporangium]|uniref:LuxR C-terminal-related transcriptional regulator n=1 Tax=Cryptosporangium minutisporangium TaxID=113569 RepID=A0ABP6SSQ1_9ACTN